MDNMGWKNYEKLEKDRIKSGYEISTRWSGADCCWLFICRMWYLMSINGSLPEMEKIKTVRVFSEGLDRIKTEWKEDILNAKLLGTYEESVYSFESQMVCTIGIAGFMLGIVTVTLSGTVWVEWIENKDKIIEVL